MCGRGKLFKGWFQTRHHCEHCEFVFERDPGFFLGSTYINYGLTTVISTGTFVVSRFVLDLPARWLIPALATFCVIFPLICFPFARSLWLALDAFLDRTGAAEQRVSQRSGEVEKSE
jgi:uncharacterized protein (DUF983 family)